MRILVIDDEADIRDTLGALLSSIGYEVSAADSGAAAIERAERESFDLAITDLRMPDMSGEETIAALRRIDPDLPMIVVSGYVSDESAQRCYAQGGVRIVCKPFDIDDVLGVVAAALRDRPRAAAPPAATARRRSG
jgi:two-component system response regulator PilR (NtrC family)